MTYWWQLIFVNSAVFLCHYCYLLSISVVDECLSFCYSAAGADTDTWTGAASCWCYCITHRQIVNSLCLWWSSHWPTRLSYWELFWHSCLMLSFCNCFYTYSCFSTYSWFAVCRCSAVYRHLHSLALSVNLSSSALTLCGQVSEQMSHWVEFYIPFDICHFGVLFLAVTFTGTDNSEQTSENKVQTQHKQSCPR